MTYQAIIPSPLGKILLEGTEKGVSRISFWKEDTSGMEDKGMGGDNVGTDGDNIFTDGDNIFTDGDNIGTDTIRPDIIPDCLKECAQQLDEYFAGTLKEFDLKLDFGDAPPFHQEVWKMVKLIPYGRTRTYADIAEIIDHNLAYRAVGHANGMNPLPIVIPCHRVIGKDGSLTGYAYGLEMKRWLLSHESPGQYMKQGNLVDALEAVH